jgi:hypothetical protein
MAAKERPCLLGHSFYLFFLRNGLKVSLLPEHKLLYLVKIRPRLTQLDQFLEH